jgi:hypothetical protein
VEIENGKYIKEKNLSNAVEFLKERGAGILPFLTPKP